MYILLTKSVTRISYRASISTAKSSTPMAVTNEKYIIGDEFDLNQNINGDVRQRFEVQKLYSMEAFTDS